MTKGYDARPADVASPEAIVAHIWSSYKAARTPGGEPIHSGANSIQLWNDGSRWWILADVWDSSMQQR